MRNMIDSRVEIPKDEYLNVIHRGRTGPHHIEMLKPNDKEVMVRIKTFRYEMNQYVDWNEINEHMV